jgi:predicted TIM-barrel fold metal-dependent hydrolase
MTRSTFVAPVVSALILFTLHCGGPGTESGEATGGEDTGGEATGGEDTGGEATGGEATGGEDTGGEDTGGEIGDECEDLSAHESHPPYTGTLVDAHGHFMPAWAKEVVPTMVQAADLAHFVILGVKDTYQYEKTDPDTYTYCAWFDVGEEDLEGVVAMLDAGARCLGETSIRHFASGPNAEAKDHDPTSEFLTAVYAEAASHQVPINVHFDYSDEHVGEYKAALDAHPDTSFIWAHMGDANAAQVRDMLDAHDNLFVDISSRNPLCSFGGRLLPMDEQRLDDGDLKLKEGWRQLFEDHSDRVLYGSDVGPGDRHLYMEEIANHYRALLGQLSPEAAERIGHLNAEGLFGVQ